MHTGYGPAGDALRFPVLFPEGGLNNGWQLGLPQSRAGGGGRTRNITAAQFYRYRFHHRKSQSNHLLRAGKLYQAYVLFAYLKYEENLMFYFRQEAVQQRLRVELYGELKARVERAKKKGVPTEKIGKPAVLPSSVSGSPRSLRMRRTSSFALLRQSQRYHSLSELGFTDLTSRGWSRTSSSTRSHRGRRSLSQRTSMPPWECRTQRGTTPQT